MAEERMLSDEILLGLIKANGGGGGTNDYNDLLNQPSINNTTLEGDMSAEDLGLANKTTVDGILNGTDIDSFADVETALNGKQASLSVGDYIDISNGEISVDRVIPNEIVSYKIVTKNVSSSQQDNTITVTKMVNGVVAWSNDYTAYELEQEHAEHRVVFDDMLWVGYGATSGGQWCYGVLEASDTHSAGYVYDWSWYVEVDITEEFSTVDHSGEKLIIKSELDAAIANKQDKLTFDDVPTNNSDNPVKSNGIYDALADKTDTDMVAADFNAGTSYTTGNYCVQDGKLYRFKNNHSGAWSASDVEEIKIAGELSSLKSGLTNVESNLDDVVVEYAGPAHTSDGRYYYFFFETPFQSDCNRKFFDIIYGAQNSVPTQVPCMYNTDGSTTAWVTTDDTNITATLADGQLTITVDCGASAWVLPALRIKKKYGDLLTIH